MTRGSGYAEPALDVAPPSSARAEAALSGEQSRRVADSRARFGAQIASAATPVDLDITVLMPCLNEARTLAACIASAGAALKMMQEKHGLMGEMLVVDNGSDDGSPELAEALGARVVSCRKRGYGAALRAGMLAARGRNIVMGDADASYDFGDAVPMIERLEGGCDLCMGSRFAGRILPGAMPWKNRYIGNPLLTGLLNMLFHSGFSDAHCGLRALTKAAFLRINPTSSGMEFASEMVIKAALLDCRRAEVPVVLRPDGRGRPPHLEPFRDGWRHLRYLIVLGPASLYLVPGLVFLALGATLFALLLDAPTGSIVALGPVRFGDHWLALAAGMLVCGHLLILFAMAASLVGLRSGYRRMTPLYAFLSRASRLEHLLLLSVIFLVLGAVTLGNVIFTWAGGNFGPLNMQRQMIGGTAALVLAVQSFFGAFLLSLIAGLENATSE